MSDPVSVVYGDLILRTDGADVYCTADRILIGTLDEPSALQHEIDRHVEERHPASASARRQAAWQTPLGRRAQDERGILYDLAVGAPIVTLSSEHLWRISELLADLVERPRLP